jgi:hypothetical protein
MPLRLGLRRQCEAAADEEHGLQGEFETVWHGTFQPPPPRAVSAPATVGDSQSQSPAATVADARRRRAAGLDSQSQPPPADQPGAAANHGGGEEGPELTGIARHHRSASSPTAEAKSIFFSPAEAPATANSKARGGGEALSAASAAGSAADVAAEFATLAETFARAAQLQVWRHTSSSWSGWGGSSAAQQRCDRRCGWGP